MKIPFTDRKFRPFRNLPKPVQQLIDQILHVIVAGAIVWIFATLTGSVPLAAAVSVVTALVREFWFQWPIQRAWDTTLDLFFWSLGTAMAAVFLSL